MKHSIITTTLLLVLTSSTLLAQKNLIKLEVPDTIYIDNEYKIAANIIESNFKTITYTLPKDETQTVKQVATKNVKGIHKVKNRDKVLYMLDTAAIPGNTLFMQAIPINKKFSSFWYLSIDSGLPGIEILSDKEGDPIKFASEMACINWLITTGWELHLINNVETGSATGNAWLSGIGLGVEYTLSQNVYFFKKQM